MFTMEDGAERPFANSAVVLAPSAQHPHLDALAGPVLSEQT